MSTSILSSLSALLLFLMFLPLASGVGIHLLALMGLLFALGARVAEPTPTLTRINFNSLLAVVHFIILAGSILLYAGSAVSGGADEATFIPTIDVSEEFACINTSEFPSGLTLVIQNQTRYEAITQLATCQLPEINFRKQTLVSYTHKARACSNELIVYPEGITDNTLILYVAGVEQPECPYITQTTWLKMLSARTIDSVTVTTN